MTEMMALKWWARVDRHSIIEGVRRIVRTGGLLALVGEEQDGLEYAAALAVEELQRLGWVYRTVLITRGLHSVKQHLLLALDELRPPMVGSLRPRTVFSGETTTSIVDELVEEVQRHGGRLALVFRQIDASEPPLAELQRLHSIALRAKCPFIVTGHAKTSWKTIIPVEQVILLTRFDRQEVRDCMLAAPELTSMPPTEVDRWLDQLFKPNVKRIAPLTVYTRLQTLAT